jgi:hypothetical protein
VNGIRLALAPASPLKCSDAAAGALPSRVKLLGWGRNATSEGVVIVDDLTAKVFSANQKAIGRERVPVDFEHNTVPGTPEYKRTTEPRAVAGHAALVCIPNEGIFGEAITYTATGQKAALDFEDVSLAPYLDKDRRVIGAHSFALTHTGATYGLNFEQAALSAGDNQLGAELKILSAGAMPAVDPNTQNTPMIKLAVLAAALGLAETADEAAVSDALRKRLTPAAAPAPVDLAPLAARIDALENLLKASEKTASDIKRSQLVTLFATSGKVPKKADGTNYSADELKALNLETLELLLANTAVTVPLAARTAPHQTEAAKSFKDDKGNVDLSALFNAEAQKSGLTTTPNV